MQSQRLHPTGGAVRNDRCRSLAASTNHVIESGVISVEIFGADRPTTAGFVNTYPPRQCGIATFARDLAAATLGVPDRAVGLRAASSSVSVEVVALDAERRDFPDEVRLRLNPDERAEYVAIARRMNERHYDVVSVQHEFGIYGGEDGEWILDLLERLEAPIVTTLHTVLAQPSANQRRIIEEIGRLSSRVVVLSRAAASRLGPIYRVDPALIEVVPHGVPDLGFVDPETRKPEFGLAGRPVLLSFGLLSPGKGFELAIEAMASVVRVVPDTVYVILGSTHPELRRREGEQYREALTARARTLGLEDHVRFVDSYVDQPTLGRWLQAADVYVTSYPGADQVASGTLAYALGAGKALVSTPYAYARELLADGRGQLVPFGEPEALADAVAQFLTDPAVRDRARRLAYRHGRSMTWPVVGERYRQVFADVIDRRSRAQRSVGTPQAVTTARPRSLIESGA